MVSKKYFQHKNFYQMRIKDFKTDELEEFVVIIDMRMKTMNEAEKQIAQVQIDKLEREICTRKGLNYEALKII